MAEQRTISLYSCYDFLSLCLSLYSHFILFTLSKKFKRLLLEELTTGSGLLRATFFEGLLGLGRIPFLRYYGDALYPPQGFRCEV